MKKIGILLLLLVCLTGCTIVRIDTTNIDNTLSVVLSKNNQLYNRIGRGYKYYVPRGVTYIESNDLNEKLYDNGNYYYLYIDAISYYYQKKIDYEENANIYYSRKINGNGKEGYLEIVREQSKYHITFVYNYARIEAIVNKEEIERVILNASYILSTIKFNPEVIKLMLNDQYFVNQEEKYDIFSPTTKEDNSLKTDTKNK